MPTPVKLTIKFKANTIEEFVERYGVYVSQGGIFVRTKKPLPVGSVLDFEFKLQNGNSLLTGQGTVVWTRENDSGRKSAPPGMGLRYDSLNQQSQNILQQILSMKTSPEQEKQEIETSPGNQNEKTKVADASILSKLRETLSENSVITEIDSPNEDLFDDQVLPSKSDNKNELNEEKPKPDNKNELNEEKPKPDNKNELNEEKPKPDNEEKPKPDNENELNEEKPKPNNKNELNKEKSHVSTNRNEDVTPIPTISQPLIPTESTLAGIEDLPLKQNHKKSSIEKEKSDKEMFDVINNALSSEKTSDSKSSQEKVQSTKEEEEQSNQIIEEEEIKPESSLLGVIISIIIILGLLISIGIYFKKPILNFITNNKETSSNNKKPSIKQNKNKIKTKPVVIKKKNIPNKTIKQTTNIKTKITATVKPKVATNEISNNKNKQQNKQAHPLAPPPAKCVDGEFPVEITTVPAGANIAINLIKQKLKTPASICLRKAKGYEVKTKLRGYLTKSTYISHLNKPKKIHFQLKPYPRKIIIQTKPKGAMVWIDSKEVGRSTISVKYPAPQEFWKVKIVKKGYKPVQFKIYSNDKKWTVKKYLMMYSYFQVLKK